ncbi:hypothetical protein QOZ95_005299 [Paenibacillus brasilensis]|uniref:Uncharacterized protein n=1 Tax=Paenibacillus brasilensis TaxID=128574 RepID=A0ABU0L720_9BACL|nr:hypothetical protein [Paenibacillus brasilensis]
MQDSNVSYKYNKIRKTLISQGFHCDAEDRDRTGTVVTYRRILRHEFLIYCSGIQFQNPVYSRLLCVRICSHLNCILHKILQSVPNKKSRRINSLLLFLPSTKYKIIIA